MRSDIVNERSRSEWIALINEWVHDERDRHILIRCLLDGVSTTQAGDEIGLLKRQTERRLSRAERQLSKHI